MLWQAGSGPRVVCLMPLARPVESQLGPWSYEQHGPLCRSSSTGQEWATTNANQFKTLIKHWYSIMQSSNCSMLMYIGAHNIVKLTSKKVTVNQAPSIRANLTSKEVLRELTNERPTNGFWNVILQ